MRGGWQAHCPLRPSLSPPHHAACSLPLPPAAASNLRRIVGSKKSSLASMPSGGSVDSVGLKDSLAERQAEVEVAVDNETSGAHSMMTLRCRDRKGLLYDLFRSLKDIDLR